MTENAELYRQRLSQELGARTGRNPRYSVRAFAKALAIDAGTLSRVLAGKQIPSFKLSLRIARGIGLSPEERERFLASVAVRHRARNLQRVSPLLLSHAPLVPPKDLSLDLYRLLGDWHHFAILELTYVKGFRSSPTWIARELGITAIEARSAVERLLEFRLLREENGRLVKTDEQLSSADKDLTHSAQKRSQRQFLEKAIEAIDDTPLEERSHTAMLMAIDPRKLPAAKKMIREFNQKLCRFLESGDRRRVYNLGVALYPLQAPRKGPKR